MIGRREFVKGALASGAGLALGSAGCTLEDRASSSTPASGRSDVSAFELDEVTLQDLAASMQSGQRSSRSITELYLRRIEEIDRTGPGLRSIIEVNPDALAVAEQLDAERAASGPRGPLHGIPVLLKDNVDTHDGMTT